MKLFVLFGALLLPFSHALTADQLGDALAAFNKGDLATAETAVAQRSQNNLAAFRL